MTTRTLTLTDFLLARIAEDERKRSPWETVDDLFHLDDNRAHWVRKRRQAECEAKRRIVGDDALRSFLDQGSVSVMGARILGYLALPYADHPDYREEWRP